MDEITRLRAELRSLQGQIKRLQSLMDSWPDPEEVKAFTRERNTMQNQALFYAQKIRNLSPDGKVF